MIIPGEDNFFIEKISVDVNLKTGSIPDDYKDEKGSLLTLNRLEHMVTMTMTMNVRV